MTFTLSSLEAKRHQKAITTPVLGCFGSRRFDVVGLVLG
jgi:hypothetical protein